MMTPIEFRDLMLQFSVVVFIGGLIVILWPYIPWFLSLFQRGRRYS